MIQILSDLQKRGVFGAGLCFLRMPGICHEEGEKCGKHGVQFHVSGKGGTGSNMIQMLEAISVFCSSLRSKSGQAAALHVLLVDVCRRGTVKMYPGQTPQILACLVKVRLSAVDKDAVSGSQLIFRMVVGESSCAGADKEEEVGGQVFTLADMRFCGLEGADLLDVEQGELGKIRGSVDDTGGIDQVAVKERCVVHLVRASFFSGGKAVVLFLLLYTKL